MADAPTPDRPMTPERLVERLIPEIRVVDGESLVPLRAAAGRVLASDLIAPEPVPRFARSGVDGYALKGDATAGAVLPIIGRIAAGRMGEMVVDGTNAVAILTGAPIPAGADRMVMLEDCEALDGAVRIVVPPAAGNAVRAAGEDFERGAVVVSAGTRLDPRHLAGAAAAGFARIPVRRRPRVGLLTSGDELIVPGQPLPPGAIYDSNTILLSTLLEAAGVEVVDLGRAPDEREATTRAIAAAERCDALVACGGVSVGDTDHVRPAVLATGGRIDHWRLPIKPGKPIAVGRLGSGALFLGLPGNPVAAFVTFALVASPLLRALAGQKPRAPVMVEVENGATFTRQPGRMEYIPVQVEGTRAFRLGTGSSGQSSAIAGADALMIVPADPVEIPAGARYPALIVSTLIG